MLACERFTFGRRALTNSNAQVINSVQLWHVEPLTCVDVNGAQYRKVLIRGR